MFQSETVFEALIEHIASLPTIVPCEHVYNLPDYDQKVVARAIKWGLDEGVLESRIMPIAGELIRVIQLTPLGAQRYGWVIHNVIVRDGNKHREEPQWFRDTYKSDYRTWGKEITVWRASSDRITRYEPLEDLVDGCRVSYYKDFENRGETHRIVMRDKKEKALEFQYAETAKDRGLPTE